VVVAVVWHSPLASVDERAETQAFSAYAVDVG
jgi:hypothetical protein